jgi:uncharacterized protein YkwD
MVAACSPAEDVWPAAAAVVGPPPVIEASPMVPEHPASLAVDGLASGTPVYFVGGGAIGAGPCPTTLPACLDVVGAVLLGRARADTSGRAALSLDEPTSLSVGQSVALQAVAIVGGNAAFSAPLATEIADPFDLCDPSGDANWLAADAAAECDLLAEMNAVRATGADCGSSGVQPPTYPMVMQPQLRTAARVHNSWMIANNSFTHASQGGPLGDTLSERVTAVGYVFRRVSENILRGQPTPTDAVDRWLTTPPHCANLLDSSKPDVGLARLDPSGQQIHWTAVFASPR